MPWGAKLSQNRKQGWSAVSGFANTQEARLVKAPRVHKCTESKAGPAYLVASKGVDMHQGG